MDTILSIIGQPAGVENVGDYTTTIKYCVGVLVVIIVFIELTANRRKCKSNIPGPWQLPLIGTLYCMGTNPNLAFQRLRRKYGDVFKIKVGSQEMVIICGLDLIQEAMIEQNTAFAGRPKLFTFQYLSEGKSLSFDTYSEYFKQQRKMAEWSLNKFLNVSDFVNTTVHNEASSLAEKLLMFQEQPIDPLENIMWSVGHVTYKMCFGDSHTEVEDFESMIKGTVELINSHNTGSVINFFPWTRKFIKWKCQKIENICKSLCFIAKKKEREHKKSFDPTHLRNALDALLLACSKIKTPIDMDRILHTSQDFIGAGLDIVYITLTWAVLYLAEYPDIQDRVMAEIASVIQSNGAVRAPRREDASKMPYTQAFIYEVIRNSSVVPLALPHSTIEDTYLGHYFLPQNTFVMLSLHSVHKDPILWKNPDDFNPDRFLDDRGEIDLSEIEKKFIPFGIGKRRCIGDQLAKQELFMFICTLLQSCRFRKPDSTVYDLNPVFGVVLRPKPYKVIVSKVN